MDVSRAVLVDGGLTPPPSKLYPGTKCYMVTVATVDGNKHCGFGPSPSIAKRSAIIEACNCLAPLPSNRSTVRAQASIASSSDSEEEESLRVSQPNEDEVKEKLASGGVSNDPTNAALQSGASDHLIDTLFKVANRKGVKINFTFFTTNVVAEVVGKRLLFVGRNKDRLLAQREAAWKMLDALEKWPDKPGTCSTLPQFLPLPHPHPILMSPYQHPQRYPPALPQGFPRGPAMMPPSRPFRPPSPQPLPSHPILTRPMMVSPTFPPSFSNTGLCLHPSMTYMPEGRAPPPSWMEACEEDKSSSEEEENCQQLSLGLCEVVPPQVCPHTQDNGLTKNSISVARERNTNSKNLPFIHRNQNRNQMSKNISLSSVSPFDDSFSHFSDPFQFTVRVPRKQKCENSKLMRRPPWKSIRCADSQTAVPSGRMSWRSGSSGRNPGKDGTNSIETKYPEEQSTNSVLENVRVCKKKLELVTQSDPMSESSGFGDSNSKDESLESKSDSVFPTHFLLQGGAATLLRADEKLSSGLCELSQCVGLPTEGSL